MRRGFTLLELMIAVFLLALSATVLMGTQNTSVRMMGYANNTAIVTMLTRAKMQDLEYYVMQTIENDGVQGDYIETLQGNFGEEFGEEYADISWEAIIQSTDITEDAANDFVSSVEKQLFGSGNDEGTLSGNTTVTSYLPEMVGFLPMILNQLGQRIRKVTLTTTWSYLNVEQTLTVSQFITVLKVDAASGVSGSSLSGTNDGTTTTDDSGETGEGGTNNSKKTGSGSSSSKIGGSGSKGSGSSVGGGSGSKGSGGSGSKGSGSGGSKGSGSKGSGSGGSKGSKPSGGGRS